MLLVSSCLLSKSWFERKGHLVRLSGPPLNCASSPPSLPCFEAHELLWITGLPESCVVENTCIGMGEPRNKAGAHVQSTSSAHMHMPLCHWTSLTEFKGKISSWWQQDIKLNAGAYVDMSHAHETSPALHFCCIRRELLGMTVRRQGSLRVMFDASYLIQYHFSLDFSLDSVVESESVSCSVMSDSLWPHGL